MPIDNDPFNSLTTLATYAQPALVTEEYAFFGLNKEICAKTPDGSPGPGGIRVTVNLEIAAQWLDAFAKLWDQVPLEDQAKYSSYFPLLEPNPNAVGAEVQFIATSLRAYAKRDDFLLAALEGAMNLTK